MANAWFRMYSEFASDPKVQSMSEAMQRRLTMLLCSRCNNETLDETLRAFHWRISETELAETKALFIQRGFIDENWNLLNWNKRQFISDSSTVRTRRYRERMETSQERHKAVTVTPPEQNRTDTEADTETDKKPSRAKRTGGEKVVKHSTDPRHVGCKEAVFAYYRSKNNVDPDWDGAEGKALGMFLNANPEIGPDQVTAMLRNRFLSDVNHGDRPAKWIRGLKSFLGGPVDRFGKPMHQTAAKIDRNSERYTWRQKEQEEMIRRGDLVQ